MNCIHSGHQILTLQEKHKRNVSTNLQHVNAHHTEHESKEDGNEKEIKDGSDTLDKTQAHILQLLYPVDGLQRPHRQHHIC